MTSKPTPPSRMAPLQRVVAQTITGPDEIRKLEESTRSGNQLHRTRKLCRTLPEAERLALLARLVPLLADEDQIELLDEVVRFVGSDVLKQFETELLGRQENQSLSSPSDPQS